MPLEHAVLSGGNAEDGDQRGGHHGDDDQRDEHSDEAIPIGATSRFAVMTHRSHKIRACADAGISCVVAAPSKIRAASDRVKTDRRDAERVIENLSVAP